VEVDQASASEGADWLARIEAEHAGELTPERLAAMEAAAAQDDDADARLLSAIESPRTRPDEERSPVAGRRFSRA
jgi:hypothetical protein